MDELNKPLSWKDHNRLFAELAGDIPWVPRFRLWSYYLLQDRKAAKPLRRVFKITKDILYAAYFLSKCIFFSIFTHRTKLPAGRTLVFLSTSVNYLPNMLPVVTELNKRKHHSIIICNHRVQKQITELYGLSYDDTFSFLSFERALSTVGRIKSVKNCALGLVRACRDVFVFLGSDLRSKSLISPHFFIWSFYQHMFSEGCTNMLAISRNIIAMNDYFLWESLYYFNAQNLPIETFVLQHGVFGMAYNPPLAKKYLLWGRIEEAQFTGPLGCSHDRCIVTGSPKFDEIRNQYLQRKKSLKERKKIVFLSSMLSFFSEEHRPEYLKVCRWFLRLSTLGAAGDYKFIFKIHPYENVDAYKDLLREYSTTVTVEKGGLFDLLLDAKITISHSSTAIYESLVMEVPSIQVVPENLPAKNRLWEWGVTKQAATYEEFEHVATRLMSDDTHYETTLKEMSTALGSALVNMGHSSEIITDLFV
jgi:hypothetical protein